MEKYYLKFIDWSIRLTTKWFPNWTKTQEEKIYARISQIVPGRMTIEQVMILTNSSRWWAKQILKSATRRGDFVEHIDKETGEHYWGLPEGYADAFREEFIKTNGESFWTFKEKFKHESINK